MYNPTYESIAQESSFFSFLAFFSSIATLPVSLSRQVAESDVSVENGFIKTLFHLEKNLS